MRKYFIVLILLLSCLAVFYMAPLALAQSCNPDGTSPAGNAICNPAPGIFVDLADKGGNTFSVLLKYVVGIILPLVGIVAVLFLIIGGYQYISSGANEELAETGKKTMRNAIIGLVVVILSYVIVVVVINALLKV